MTPPETTPEHVKPLRYTLAHCGAHVVFEAWPVNDDGTDGEHSRGWLRPADARGIAARLIQAAEQVEHGEIPQLFEAAAQQPEEASA